MYATSPISPYRGKWLGVDLKPNHLARWTTRFNSKFIGLFVFTYYKHAHPWPRPKRAMPGYEIHYAFGNMNTAFIKGTVRRAGHHIEYH
jgi:hypothetical protein